MPADLYYADMDGGDWDFNRNGIYGEVGEVNEIELTPTHYYVKDLGFCQNDHHQIWGSKYGRFEFKRM